MPIVNVDTVAKLLEAVERRAPSIGIAGELRGVPSFTMWPEQSLVAAGTSAALHFAPGIDGIGVTADNRLERLTIEVGRERRAIHVAAQDAHANRGKLALVGLTVTGQLQLLFDDRTRTCRLRFENVHVRDADLHPQLDRPHGNGVSCLQGALTVWNRAEAATTLDVELDGVRIGSEGQPVRGTGVFIAGKAADGGGQVRVARANIGPTFIDSGLEAGDASTICGGVFVLPGAHAEQLCTSGLQQSHGPNAVPVDNWGRVAEWICDGDVVTHGLNAVAMVNAGWLGRLDIRGALETHGDGARGCAVYGPMGSLELSGVLTRGRAATGVQVCNRLETLRVSGAIDIRGLAGTAMVKGQMLDMHADGVHIEAAGHVGVLDIGRVQVADPGGRAVRDERVASGQARA